MPPRRRTPAAEADTTRAPARTPDEREAQLISLAYDRAEQQIRDGTASSQVISHFLKLGSSREKAEQTRIQHEIALMESKRDALEDQKKVGEAIDKALRAMRQYQGLDEPNESEEGDGYED